MRKSKALAMALAAVALAVSGGTKMAYFRAADAAAYARSVKSIRNLQQGRLYAMTWDADADYHLDRVLASGCRTSNDVLDWLSENVLNGAPSPKVVASRGCSAFAATNTVGEQLMGRNFDYVFSMTHLLLFVPRNAKLGRKYASVSTVDAGWVGYDVGQLDDGTRDLSYAALFPHIPMDGMNEKGVAIAVLSLDGRKGARAMTEQFHPSRASVTATTAMRCVLDNAASTAEGVEMLTNRFNMFAAMGGDVNIVANYHLYLCDRSGDSRVVEWMPPAKAGESWLPVVTRAREVTNFYLADGYGHGRDRWQVLRDTLAAKRGHLEMNEAMDLCRAVSQPKGAKQTSWTHWSVVYNLAGLTVDIAMLRNYDEVFSCRLDSDSNGWISPHRPLESKCVAPCNGHGKPSVFRK